jgi:hypothetical protein
MRDSDNRLVCSDRAAMVAAVRRFQMTVLLSPALGPPRAIYAE